MDDKQIGEELLRLDKGQAPTGDDLQAMTQKLLRRDRRRVAFWAALSVFLWVIASSGFFLLGYVFFTAIVPKLDGYARQSPAGAKYLRLWTSIGLGAVTVILGSVAASLLAAISTVVLIVTSRRATLRQINASLQIIAREVQQLREKRDRPA